MGARTTEEVLLLDIDRTTCKKLMGDVDERGICVIKVRTDADNPNAAELLKIRHTGGHRAVSDG